jgi:hypothetical protein
MWKIAGIVGLALGASIALSGAPQEAGESSEVERIARLQEHRELARVGLVDPAPVVAWNLVLYEVAFTEDQFLTFKGHRAFSMMHLAMHDALNAVVPLYDQFALRTHESSSDPVAAAAQAAYDVAISQYPQAHMRLDSERNKWLAQIPDGPHKTRGIALGRRSAAAILAARAGDGWDNPGTYGFSSQVGAYQTTPPWNGFVLQPGFRFARPFGLSAPHQFRPSPPPELAGAGYTASFNEVKSVGSMNSVARTPEQTLYAVWWMEFAEGSVNRLARDLVTQRRTHLWQAARLFALLNMSLFDGYVATWDSKYEHNHWRPYTAIRAASLDGNPGTEADPAWEPLRTTPPFPEYVSAHAAGTAASLEILKRTLGDRGSFTMQTLTAPPGMPTRSFNSFDAAAAECADSRVRLGWHFRYSTDAGLVLGRRVAAWLEQNYLTFRGH